MLEFIENELNKIHELLTAMRNDAALVGSLEEATKTIVAALG